MTEMGWQLLLRKLQWSTELWQVRWMMICIQLQLPAVVCYTHSFDTKNTINLNTNTHTHMQCVKLYRPTLFNDTFLTQMDSSMHTHTHKLIHILYTQTISQSGGGVFTSPSSLQRSGDLSHRAEHKQKNLRTESYMKHYTQLTHIGPLQPPAAAVMRWRWNPLHQQHWSTYRNLMRECWNLQRLGTSDRTTWLQVQSNRLDSAGLF